MNTATATTIQTQRAARICAELYPVPKATTGELCTTLRRWGRGNPLHSEVSSVFAVMAAAIKQTGALTEKCKASLIDQLDEMTGEVEQDFCNQRAEA